MNDEIEMQDDPLPEDPNEGAVEPVADGDEVEADDPDVEADEDEDLGPEDEG